MSRRTQRVASVIRSVVSNAISSRLSDPRIEPLTSITRVDVASDFSVATLYVSVFAREPRQQLCIEGLRSSAPRLRGMVAREIRLRQAPELVFRLDDSLKKSFATVEAIDRAMLDTGALPEWRQESLHTGDGQESGDSADAASPLDTPPTEDA